ncbi:hypothetical protein ACH5RR_003873 [Cinchona calisaya]|uniref:SWIM-type domain-containing protein n=1 Tax=Cinchona calisaya TaxID=153742 RepID=A0ABD3AW11_9GENT
MVEMIKRQLMKRYQDKKELPGTFTSGVCPRIMKQIEGMKFHARNFEPTLAGEGIFEVMMGVSNFIVDIERKTCSCRKYDLTGILCVHAVAVLMHSKLILKTMCTGTIVYMHMLKLINP